MEGGIYCRSCSKVEEEIVVCSIDAEFEDIQEKLLRVVMKSSPGRALYGHVGFFEKGL